MRQLVVTLSLAGIFGTWAGAQTPTFHRDVEPILQARCQTCHRPGEAAPMPLLSYNEARPWAKAIRSAVLSRKMPPWFADPEVGHFQNDTDSSQERNRHAGEVGRRRRTGGKR